MDDYEYHLLDEVRAGRLSRRQFLVRAGAVGLSVPAIATILAACSGGGTTSAGETQRATASGKPQRGGTLKMAITVPASVVDPVTLFNQGGQTTAQIAGEYLCFPNPDYSLDPRLATSWKAKSPTEWQFSLRKGVKWHNGADFTADDVVYTMNLISDPKTNSGALSAFKGIFSTGNIEKRDDYTVVFHLDSPFVDFPYLVSSFNFNAIILPKNYEIGQFAKGHVGTGPFVLTSYSQSGGAKYVKNTHYWDPQYPYLDAIDLTYYQDNSAIALNMQSGGEELWQLAPYQGTQALLKNPNITTIAGESSEWRGLHMRVDQDPFRDVNARLAIAQSIDRKQIVSSVLGGYGQVANDNSFAPIFPLSKLAVANIPQRTQDLSAAKASLAKAGMPRGFHVTLTCENYLGIPSYATLVKQQCAQVGIDINLQVEPQNVYFGSGKNQPWLEVPMGIVDWGARGTPSQAIVPAFTSSGVWNSAHWKDAAFDSLFKQFNGTLDNQTRLKLAQQLAQMQHDQVPEIISFWIKLLRYTAKNVHGLATGPADHIDPRTLWKSA